MTTLADWMGADVTGAKTAATVAVFAVVALFAFLLKFSKPTATSTVAHSKYATRKDIDLYNIETDPTKPDTVDQGIYLGTFDDPEQKWGTAELRYKGGKHLLCFGPTGSGKSASIMVPNIQNLRRSLIITDPKGELGAITERHRAKLGKTIVLNPFGMLTKNRPHLESVGWNPLAQLDPKSQGFAADAMCIADALVEKSGGDGNSKFFERSAQNLVQALVMWERMNNGDDASLRNIPTLLNKPTLYNSKTKEPISGFMHTLKCMAESGNYVLENAANGLLSRLNDPNSQSTSVRDVIDTLKSHFELVTDDNIAFDMARGGAVDFAALQREITTIYLILPPGELKGQEKWLRLFVNLALRSMYKAAPTDEARPVLPPVLFMLDEFGNLGRLEEIIKALNMARYSRIQLMFFLQNMEQLTGSYKGEVASFFSGAGASTTFKTGALDTETAEHLAKSFGNQEMRIATETHTGSSVTPQSIPLIRAEDISRLPPNTTITIIEPCPWPVKASAPIYPKTRFIDGLDPNPYYHG